MVESVKCKSTDSHKKVKRRKLVIFSLFSLSCQKSIDCTTKECIIKKKERVDLLDREESADERTQMGHHRRIY